MGVFPWWVLASVQFASRSLHTRDSMLEKGEFCFLQLKGNREEQRACPRAEAAMGSLQEGSRLGLSG